MNFTEIAQNRQSCRGYIKEKTIEKEKLDAILASARLAPSACNGQPYHLTVCTGETAEKVAECTMGMGLNKFAPEASALIVVSEKPYVASAGAGAKLKGNDYRSIDMGIVAAYITAEAAAQGIGSCILGWFDERKIRKICNTDGKVRLVITLGYAKDERVRSKKRKNIEELVTIL